MKAVSSFARRFFGELLLQSGQFALFYLMMQFSLSGWAVFSDLGHSALLLILVLQTSVLVLWGDRPWVRFFGSLIAPLGYSLLEGIDGSEFLLNAAHVGFWVFSVATAGLQAVALRSRRVAAKALWEFWLTVLNVGAFFVLYFYFDTLLTVKNQGSELTLVRIFSHWSTFVSDQAHVYVLAGGLLLAFVLALGRTEVLKLKERLNTLFGQYVDQDFRDQIVAGQGLQSRRMELAVLFSDLRDFTASSEGASPEAVTAMLNLYFSQWTAVVRRHGGVVDKFIGDAVMVLFGLRGEAGACEAAVACGREMLALWPELRAELDKRHLPTPTGMGIGLHFGPVLLGDIGSEERRNFTVIGDTVNTASRLEASCKTTGQVFLVSGSVRERLSPTTAEGFASVGNLSLKGKQQAMEVWAPVR